MRILNRLIAFIRSPTSNPHMIEKFYNSKYQEWVLVDQNLAAALCSMLSQVILPYVIHLESTSDIWATIERRLQSSNRSRVIHLKNELHNVQMKNQTMSQYLT